MSEQVALGRFEREHLGFESDRFVDVVRGRWSSSVLLRRTVKRHGTKSDR